MAYDAEAHACDGFEGPHSLVAVESMSAAQTLGRQSQQRRCRLHVLHPVAISQSSLNTAQCYQRITAAANLVGSVLHPRRLTL